MIYKVLRYLARMACKIYFRNIYINGREKLKAGVPYFIACNHPNGFAEPILLSCFVERELHFLVRGDVFEKAWLRPLLLATNQIPIFRTRDGFANLRNNFKSINATTEALSNNSAILIFVEGTTKLAKKLRPLQKGMARMGFKAMEKVEGLEPQVLPVGVNFSDPEKFNSEVFIEIGEPLNISDYYEEYKENKNTAIAKLTSDTFTAMKPLVLEVRDERLDLYESAVVYTRNKRESFLPIGKIDGSRYKEEANFVAYINELDDEEAEKLRMEIYSIEKKKVHNNLNLPIALAAFPAFVGFILHFIPVFLTNLLADNVVKSQVFYSSIRIAAGLGIMFVYYVLIILLLLIIWPQYLWIVILMWLSGVAYQYYYYLKEESKKEALKSYNIKIEMI